MTVPIRPSIRRLASVVVTTSLMAACGTMGTADPGASASPSATRSSLHAGPGSSPSAAGSAPAPWNDPATATGPAALSAGSDPSVLPAPVLVADKKNNRLVVIDPQGRVRWQFPRPGDLAPGQTFLIPDDAFFSPDGREIIATEEDNYVISVIDIATHRIVYRYGTPGRAGSGPEHLNNPDDALLLPDGFILSPDIKNCRILLVPPGADRPGTIFGRAVRPCDHQPPARFGSPNGAFPMVNGDYLVTEINGDWVDEMSLSGHIVWSTHPPRVAYPSDTNEIGPNRYLTVDYSAPGQVVIFDRTGRALWRYRPSGASALDHPSLALPLPGGDIVLNDDYNHRVIVVDPHTSRVVWQYGHLGVPSAAPGYLNNPDGLDLVPPYSLLTTHAATMGQP